MSGSHTLSLLDEAFEKVQEFNYKRYVKQIESMSKHIPKTNLNKLKQKVNQILERIGLHLTYKSVFEELENDSYSKKMGKWSSVGTLQLALKDPNRFDEVYNLLTDQDSKDTFDWFIKYRVAYSFVNNITGKIDYVVNTAAILKMGPLSSRNIEDIFYEVKTNYLGSVNVVKASIEFLRKTKGSILLFTSSSYTRGRQLYSIYSSSKAAIVNFVQGMAEELYSDSIRINALNPERTATPMRFENFGKEPIESY